MLDLRQGYVGIDGGAIANLSNMFAAATSDRWSSLSIGYRMALGDFIGDVSVTRILDQPVSAFSQDRKRFWFQAAIRF